MLAHSYRFNESAVLVDHAKNNGIDLRRGTYVQLYGPQYETPAEIKMYRMLGADTVAMSLADEVIAASHMGMKICGISFIANPAAGMNKNPLTHEEVQEAADLASDRFKKLVTASIRKMGELH